MALRLGFESTCLTVGNVGVNTYSVQLLHHLQELDDAPEVTLLFEWRDMSRENAIRARYPTLRWRQSVPIYELLSSRSRGMQSPSLERTKRLRRWTSKGTSRVPVLPSPPKLDICHWSLYEFLPATGTANVTTVHDLIPLRHPEWTSQSWVAQQTILFHRIASHATRIIAISEYTRRDLISLLGLPPERIDVIPEAAAPQFRPMERTSVEDVLMRYGLTYGSYLLYIGTIEPRKNLVHLAAGFAAATEQIGDRSTRLVLAGGPGPMAQQILEELATLNLGERLLLPGDIPPPDLPALVNGARALTYVSLFEGFGLPPLEAMACGTPVVTSNSSSCPEVVGDAALLADPYRVDEIAGALRRILADDALRRDLSRRGLARAATFSWTRTAQLTMDTYRRAIAERSGNSLGAYAG